MGAEGFTKNVFILFCDCCGYL